MRRGTRRAYRHDIKPTRLITNAHSALQRLGQHRFGFPYVIDETQATARAYAAQCTPDFFGFNAALELQYRGRLDSAGRIPAGPDNRRELVEAMKAIAATGRGPAQQVPGIGCSIKWRGE